MNAYFQEVEAVVQVLEEYTQSVNAPHDGRDETFDVSLREDGPTVEQFTAIWQAAELLARAYQVLIPLIQLDLSKQALVLPDSYEKPSGLLVPGDEPLPGL